jgi:hypothetical protein
MRRDTCEDAHARGIGSHVHFDGDSVSLSATHGATWLFARWTGDLAGNRTPARVTTQTGVPHPA